MIHNLAHPKEKIALWPNYIFVYNYRDWPYDKKAMIDCIRSEEALQKKDIDSNIALGIKTGGIKESKFDFLDTNDELILVTYHSVTNGNQQPTNLQRCVPFF